MSKFKTWLISRNTDEKSLVTLLIYGYCTLTFLCFILLALPFCRTGSTSITDQFFFAVSLTSTTGLAPSNFAETYNVLGQFIGLIFIQLGGIGYMALSSFIILKQFKKLPSLSARLLKLEFNLPQKYPLKSFIYSVFIFTLLVEIIGAVFLYQGFKELNMSNPIWLAIFHSISAFCTAGFSLFDDSMSSFRENSMITTTIMCLSLLGSIGFIVLLDFWMKLVSKRNRITLTSKIILFTTFIIWISASISLYFSDSYFSSQGWQGLKLSMFQSISAHTTVGFNNYDIGAMNNAAIFIMIIVMIVGASPAGTGGGIKTTSITAIFAVLKSVLQRKKHVTFFNNEIPGSNIYLAVSSVCFYIFILLLGTWAILFIEGERFPFENILFEVSSCLSTVGLSTGMTGDLSNQSKIVLSLLMFIGRLGVLTFGFALFSKAPLLRNKPKVEDIAI